MLNLMTRFLVFLLPTAVFATPMQVDHAMVELISEYDAVVPGQSFDLALRFDLEEHWHIYWKNPGASGLSTTIDWLLPERIEAGDVQWPAPERIQLGGLVNYGYEEEAVFIVTLQAPEDLKLGSDLAITANLFWLICKETCLPGEAALDLVLPVASKAEPSAEASAFTEARNRQARAAHPWATSAYIEKEALVVVIEGEALPADFYLYADAEGLVDPSAEQVRSTPAPNRAELRLALDTPFFENQPLGISGVLQSGADSWEFNAEILDTPPPFVRALTEAEPSGFEQRLLALGLPGILALAFLGGLILNIMPCVLPVLSLKVFSLLKHAGQTRSDALRHGLAYTAGVVLSFIALAAVLFALRALGERIGWGFQLQSPGFVVVLSAVFFLFGLNLMGVFELGGRLVGADIKLAKRSDVLGSFGMGVLAAVVGAPCMGPLVAGVSGLAVQANLGTGLLIFGMMGLGLASPFLVLSVFPKLVAFLPKPGLWMESFKQGHGLLVNGCGRFSRAGCWTARWRRCDLNSAGRHSVEQYRRVGFWTLGRCFAFKALTMDRSAAGSFFNWSLSVFRCPLDQRGVSRLRKSGNHCRHFGSVGRMVFREGGRTLGRRSPRFRRFYCDLVFDLSGE
jgi:thiol:disulfide interchange protein DsbD